MEPERESGDALPGSASENAGIGRVTAHGHRFDAGACHVRLLIAVERQSFADHWVEEGSKHGIVDCEQGTDRLTMSVAWPTPLDRRTSPAS